MFSPINATIPTITHVKGFEKSVTKHADALRDLESDLKNYFEKSLFSFSEAAPEELKPIYNKFIECGVSFASSFGSFIQKFEPILKSAKDLETKHTLVKDAFSEYLDSIKNVRNEETKENIDIEEKKLLDFVSKFTEFNNDSNSLNMCFLMLYSACASQLSYDTSSFLKILTKQIETMKPVDMTKEEIELNGVIAELEQEIASNQTTNNEIEKESE